GGLRRRSCSPVLGRLLHGRTGDTIAAVVSRIRLCAATIVPFDVRNRLEVLRAKANGGPNGKAMPAGAGGKTAAAGTAAADGKAGAGGQTAADRIAAADAKAAGSGSGQAVPDHHTPGAVAAGAGEAG